MKFDIVDTHISGIWIQKTAEFISLRFKNNHAILRCENSSKILYVIQIKYKVHDAQLFRIYT